MTSIHYHICEIYPNCCIMDSLVFERITFIIPWVYHGFNFFTIWCTPGCFSSVVLQITVLWKFAHTFWCGCIFLFCNHLGDYILLNFIVNMWSCCFINDWTFCIPTFKLSNSGCFLSLTTLLIVNLFNRHYFIEYQIYLMTD